MEAGLIIPKWELEDRQPVVGIIGGGQLARMLYQAGISIGVEIRILAFDKDEAAFAIAKHVEITDELSAANLYHFAKRCDVVTFDHELVDSLVIAELEERGCTIRPGSKTMSVAADKAAQRRFLSALNIPVPSFVVVNSFPQFQSVASMMTPPFVLKAATGGYDGRGVLMASNIEEVAQVLGMGEFEVSYVVEPYLALQAEIAVLSVRDPQGNIVIYPPVLTIQEDAMCVEVRTSPNISGDLLQKAQSWAAEIAEASNSIGVQAVEYFIVDGDLLVNELAPRVHNSGHLTMDASVTSQFENHLRAILELPLGSGQLLTEAAMVNLIPTQDFGHQRPDLGAALSNPAIKIHYYGKSARPKRKIGHVTALSDDPVSASKIAWEAARSALSDG